MTLFLLGVLGVVCVALKLLGFLTWSWWWITAPWWAGVLLVLGTLGWAWLVMRAGGRA